MADKATPSHCASAASKLKERFKNPTKQNNIKRGKPIRLLHCLPLGRRQTASNELSFTRRNFSFSLLNWSVSRRRLRREWDLENEVRTRGYSRWINNVDVVGTTAGRKSSWTAGYRPRGKGTRRRERRKQKQKKDGLISSKTNSSGRTCSYFTGDTRWLTGLSEVEATPGQEDLICLKDHDKIQQDRVISPDIHTWSEEAVLHRNRKWFLSTF